MTDRFGFSDKQSQHIVDMRLGRLTGLEQEKLTGEFNDLNDKIAWFNKVLTEEETLLGVIKDEITVIRNRYGDERRTGFEVGEDDDIDDESLIQEEDIMVTLTHFGYIKRMSMDNCSAQHRGGRGITGMQTREEDFVERIITTSTHATLLFFTSKGKVFRMKGYQIPESGRQARGMAVVNLLHLDAGEKIRAIIPIQSFDQGGCLMMSTKRGVVKKTELVDYSNINRNGLIAINLRDEDELIGVQLTDDTDDIILVTQNGLSIRFRSDDVRSTGRNTQGVRGISLADEDVVIGMAPTIEGKTILVISEKGFGKRTELDEYRIQTRGGKGLITYKPSEKTGLLVGLALVDDENDIVIINDLGIMIRISASEVPVLSRITQGVTLMRVRDGKVVDLACVDREACEDEEEELAEDTDETSAVEISDTEQTDS